MNIFCGNLKEIVLFSLYFNQIFSCETLEKFKEAYNMHPAPLPEGRGMFSQFWLLMYPSQTGRYYQTLHRITEKIDAGDVVLQRSCLAPTNKKTTADYMNKVTELGVAMIRELKPFEWTGSEYKPEIGSYYSSQKNRDVLAFWRSGCRFSRFRDWVFPS